MKTENEKMQVAEFRYSVISDFVNGIDMSRAEKSRLMGEKCERKWSIPFSQKTRISRETINHWIRIYNGGGLKALRPKDRSDQGRSRAMDDDTCEALICLRKEMPATTVPHLIEQMNQRKLVTPGTVLNTTTVYRFLHQHSLMHFAESYLVDRQGWEARLPNDLWQSFVMQGPTLNVDGSRIATHLITILDDHSRFVVYARFHISVTLASFLNALETAIARKGVPQKLYVHNGPAFRSRQLERITASLSVSLIKVKPYLPKGKGKIEMWYETMRDHFFPFIEATRLYELNRSLDLYINNDYHQKEHSVTGQTPLVRFTPHMICKRRAPENLKDRFRTEVSRKVANDGTITLFDCLYEAPVPLIGKRIELLYHNTKPELAEIRYKNKSYGIIQPVNLAVKGQANINIDKSYQIAMFRYGIVSDFINRKEVLKHGEKERLLRSKTSCIWSIPFSDRTYVSRGTILNWIKRFERGGRNIESLYPRRRSDMGRSRAIDVRTTDNLVILVRNSNVKTIGTVISEMKRRGLVTPGTRLSNSSVYYFLRSNGLMASLNMRKRPAQEQSYSPDEDRLWMRKLQQGKIAYEELQQSLSSEITPSDIRILQNCILKKPLIYRKRALTMLSHLKGIPKDVVSEHYLVSMSSVLNHIRIFEKVGVNGLIKDKRWGMKKHENPRYINEFFAILHTPPSTYGFNRTSWRQKDIQNIMAEKGLKICVSGIRDITKKAGYKYRNARQVLTSNDPEYRDKLKAITDILGNLGPKEKFFSVDEYGPFAIKLQGGKSLVPRGEAKTVPQWQKSKGSLIITAALELSTNQITHFYSDRKNTEEMIRLLEVLIHEYREEDRLYFSWDAASWHASKRFKERVEKANSDSLKSNGVIPSIVLAPLPTCAQFLNVIESVFSGMARAIIHNSDYSSVGECMNAIDRHFAERNQNFKDNPKRAGNKIWGKERVKPVFSESNNCKDPIYQSVYRSPIS